MIAAIGYLMLIWGGLAVATVYTLLVLLTIRELFDDYEKLFWFLIFFVAAMYLLLSSGASLIVLAHHEII